MTTLIIDDITLTPAVAAELLYLAPADPDTLSDEAALMEIQRILAAHHCNIAECESEWMQRYVEDPAYTAARMSRCTIVAARLAEAGA